MRAHTYARDILHLERYVGIDHIIREYPTRLQKLTVGIKGIEGREVWASVGTNQWVAVTIDGTRYVTIG